MKKQTVKSSTLKTAHFRLSINLRGAIVALVVFALAASPAGAQEKALPASAPGSTSGISTLYFGFGTGITKGGRFGAYHLNVALKNNWSIGFRAMRYSRQAQNLPSDYASAPANLFFWWGAFDENPRDQYRVFGIHAGRVWPVSQRAQLGFEAGPALVKSTVLEFIRKPDFGGDPIFWPIDFFSDNYDTREVRRTFAGVDLRAKVNVAFSSAIGGEWALGVHLNKQQSIVTGEFFLNFGKCKPSRGPARK